MSHSEDRPVYDDGTPQHAPRITYRGVLYAEDPSRPPHMSMIGSTQAAAAIGRRGSGVGRLPGDAGDPDDPTPEQ